MMRLVCIASTEPNTPKTGRTSVWVWGHNFLNELKDPRLWVLGRRLWIQRLGPRGPRTWERKWDFWEQSLGCWVRRLEGIEDLFRRHQTASREAFLPHRTKGPSGDQICKQIRGGCLPETRNHCEDLSPSNLSWDKILRPPTVGSAVPLRLHPQKPLCALDYV